jgi:hypothetical protein
MRCDNSNTAHAANGHLTDDELLLAGSVEEPGRADDDERGRHFRECPVCRARYARIDAILREGGEALLDGIDRRERVAPAFQRERLVAALNEAQRQKPQLAPAGQAWAWPWAWGSPSFNLLSACSAAAIALVLVGFVLPWKGPHVRARDTQVLSLPGGLPAGPPARLPAGLSAGLPAASLTPGAASRLTSRELCVGQLASPVVTEDVRRAVLRAYAMEDIPSEQYELDALITPELGGTTGIHNLWPQRYDTPVWHARVKDVLEHRLAEDVCAGRVDLARAQREISTDWIAAYQRYFHTNTPLQAHLEHIKEDVELEFAGPRSPRVGAYAASLAAMSLHMRTPAWTSADGGN